MTSEIPSISIDDLSELFLKSLWQAQPFFLYKVGDTLYEFYDIETLSKDQEAVATKWYCAVLFEEADGKIDESKFKKLYSNIARSMDETPNGQSKFADIYTGVKDSEDDSSKVFYLLKKLGIADAPQSIVASASLVALLRDIYAGSEAQAWRDILKRASIG